MISSIFVSTQAQSLILLDVPIAEELFSGNIRMWTVNTDFVAFKGASVRSVNLQLLPYSYSNTCYTVSKVW